jgi:phosphate transport system substrate-binding protein
MRGWLAGYPLAALILAATLAGCDLDSSGPASGADDGPAGVASCADGSVTAQGSSAQANAMNTWIRNYQASCPGAAVEYDSIGSGAGVEAFIAGTGDFAGTDATLSAADQSAADARCGTGPAIHLPMVVGPIALAYNVAGLDDLRLAPATIASIFAGEVTRWDDPAIAADNPAAILPPTGILAVHREDSSGTTANFTAFLAATAADDWSYGSDRSWTAPGGSAEPGNEGVSAAITKSDGAIGYIELSFAQSFGLETAQVLGGAGQFVEVSNDAAGRTVASAELAGSGSDLKLDLDYGTTAAGAYPIVLVTYEVVCQRGTPADSLGVVKGFLTYTASAAGQAAVTRLGYAPLPEEIRREVATVVAGLS